MTFQPTTKKEIDDYIFRLKEGLRKVDAGEVSDSDKDRMIANLVNFAIEVLIEIKKKM